MPNTKCFRGKIAKLHMYYAYANVFDSYLRERRITHVTLHDDNHRNWCYVYVYARPSRMRNAVVPIQKQANTFFKNVTYVLMKYRDFAAKEGELSKERRLTYLSSCTVKEMVDGVNQNEKQVSALLRIPLIQVSKKHLVEQFKNI